MTRVDSRRLKGNYATNLVATWLSQICLVRPVAEGTDIGVDLYCESVINETPFLHFWVQVKAIGRRHLSKDKNRAWYDFAVKHLLYWKRQPIPVYAFLVPILRWPPPPVQRIYGVRITEYVLQHDVTRRQNTRKRRIKTSDCIDVEAMESDLEQFVSQIIPWDSAALLLQKGAVVPISKYNQEARRHFHRGVAFKYAAKILENIRDTSAAVGLDMIENNIPEKQGVLNRFVSIAEMFEEELDEMGWSFLAWAACLNGNMQRAQAVITNACARIELQTDISTEIKRQRIGSLRTLLKELTELQSKS